MSLLKFLFGRGSKNIEVLDSSTFTKAVTNTKVQLIDVRTKAEFDAGHVKGARNIDFFQRGSFKTKFEKLDKTKPVYIYCKSGGRSRAASRVLDKMGFTKIYDLRGGYLGLN